MNILITGAGSYVGTCVQNYLLNKHKDWKIDGKLLTIRIMMLCIMWRVLHM